MKPSTPPHWKPDPQLLAAFFDGELDERAELSDLRSRIEIWLEQHPKALAEGEDLQRLRALCIDTTPSEPSLEVWSETLERIRASVRHPVAQPSFKIAYRKTGTYAAGIALLVGLSFASLRFSLAPTVTEPAAPVVIQEKPRSVAVEAAEIFPVATVDEVAILRIEGADTETLVVGALPLIGPLELAAPGEIRVVNLRPDERDRMVPRVRQHGPNLLMIWAFLDTEKE